MLYTCKDASGEYIFDSSSGAFLPFSEDSCEGVALFMLSPPLPSRCPADIRYELAKYDRSTVDSAYSKLILLYSRGLILKENINGTLVLRLDGEMCAPSADAALDALKQARGDGFSIVTVITDNPVPAAVGDFLGSLFLEKLIIKPYSVQ